jgi:hypothetical protein
MDCNILMKRSEIPFGKSRNGKPRNHELQINVQVFPFISKFRSRKRIAFLSALSAAYDIMAGYPP